MIQLFLSQDSAAIAVGANEVADFFLEQLGEYAGAFEFDLRRTSSRGLFWLEPFLEVQTPSGRVGWGPLDPFNITEMSEVFEDVIRTVKGESPLHALHRGLIENIDFLRRQNRILFSRAGKTRPLSLEDYFATEGWIGLERAKKWEEQGASEKITAEILESGLRGRGGAAFPAGIKWQTVAAQQSDQKFVVCNADEGDSGTFADRMILEGDPFLLIEGLIIAGIAVGATQAFVYIRSEYPYAIRTFAAAIEIARRAGFLGDQIVGSKKRFDIQVRKAAGSYVCGEETAMLESIEGKRGVVRAKPPLPAVQGLFGQPTLIHNVLTLASVPSILAKGASWYRSLGVGRSTGTQAFQLAGNIKHGGLVETGFGVSLEELLLGFGGGTRSGKPIKAVQVGGPLGSYVPAEKWSTSLDYESYAQIGAVVGHGGIVVHDESSNMADLAHFAMAFCAHESCGKCTPCRIGSTRGHEAIRRIQAADSSARRQEQVVLVRDLCETMKQSSLCAMGSMTPLPVLSALDYYPEDFGLGSVNANR